MTPPDTPPAPVAVLGVGRMGRHHARTYAKLPVADLRAVVDFDLKRAQTVADEYGCRAYDSVDALLAGEPDLVAASVATPTQTHLESAGALLKRGIGALVEKPLAPTVEEAAALADAAHAAGAVLQVGHTERFNPAVRAVAALDIVPRFIEIDRVSPMTFRSLDVGVVMDLMIHDLDIVLMLVRSKIERVDSVGIAVMGQEEDICDCRIEFESGCVVNLTASRVALKTERKLRLFSEDAYVSLDYQQRTGVVLRRTSNALALSAVREAIHTGADLSEVDYQDLLNVEQLTMDLPEGQDDPLTAQLTAFLHAVQSGEAPPVTAEDGYAAVDAAQRVLRGIRKHKWEGDTGEGILNALP
ncbi:MAG: Gfo/Idh/MocA family oxidoreductase [Planctomycetota bacterium]